jgi:formamidopyrimidine-DNA glycosylase
MPELPEVETVRRGLAPAMEGARIVAVEARRPDLRFPFPERFAERLTGRTIRSLGRRAKYLVADLDDGAVLLMHLGMSGSFRIEANGEGTTPGVFHHERSKLAAHDHVVFRLSTGVSIVYNDPRRFGFMTLAERATLDQHPLMRDVGVEPLGNALDGATLARLFAAKQTSLKAALSDQTLIAGLGNIYVCEALWRAGLSPRRRAGTVARLDGGPTGRAERLAAAVRAVLSDAIEAGGSSLRDYRQADGALGYFQHSFAVYDQEGKPCRRPGCGGVIRRTVQANRSTYYCPVCQR